MRLIRRSGNDQRHRRFTTLVTAALAALTLASASAPAGGGTFASLEPGRSTLADAQRVLGAPLPREYPPTFAGDRFDARAVVVEVDSTGKVIESIGVRPKQPPARGQMLQWLGLNDAGGLTSTDQSADLELFAAQGLALRMRDGQVIELIYLAPQQVIEAVDAMHETALRHRRGDALLAATDLVVQQSSDPEPYFQLAETLNDCAMDEAALAAVQRGLQRLPDHERGRLLKWLIEASIDLGRDEPAWLGAHLSGDMVVHVFEGGPADAAGWRAGDEIVSVGTQTVQNDVHLRRMLSQITAGTRQMFIMKRGEKGSMQWITPTTRAEYFARHDTPGDALVAAMTLIERGSAVEAATRLNELIDSQTKGSPRRNLARFVYAGLAEALSPQRGLEAWGTYLQEEAGRDVPEHRRRAQRRIEVLTRDVQDYQQAAALWKQKHYREALTACDRIPMVGSAGVPRLKALCLAKLGDYGQAAEVLRQSARWWPGEPQIWSLTASYYATFDLARCRAAAQRCARLTRGSDDPRYKQLYATSSELQAKAESAAALVAAAGRYRQNELWRPALQQIEAAAHFMPDNSAVRYQRAHLLARHLDRAEEAVALLQQDLDQVRSPLTRRVLTLTAQIHYQARRYRQAADCNRRALELDPRNMVCLYNLAMATQHFAPRDAVALWQRYLKLSEDDPNEKPHRADVEQRVKRLMAQVK